MSGDAAKMAGLKIGFVDLDAIFDQSRAIKSAVAKADSGLDEQTGRMRELQREYRSRQQKLDAQGSVLSDSERKRIQGEMSKMIDEMDELDIRIQRDLRDRDKNTIDPVLKAVLAMIAEMGKREGYDMILRGDSVLYGRNTTDLTGKVFEELDRRADELLAAAGPRGEASVNDTPTSGTALRTKPLEPLKP